MSDRPLLAALRDSGRLTADQVTAATRAFADAGADAGRLADLLLQAGCVTKYQHRKIQLGRADDLVFGHYLILERIGEGGMGKVYRAVELRLGRTMALKTIRPNLLANKTVISRYKREARAAAALQHPNIVELYEAEDFDGRYYLAMEFVEGMDLSRLMKELIKDKRTVAPAEAAEYIRQAALGLQHAHEKGFVHRDIKPSNLLVCGERAIPGTGGKAVVKILDMGLVRSLTEDDSTQVDLTRDGTVVGTPDYMSPEQAKNSSTVDHRADIYSLGCTLFYLLKGSPPYSEGTAIDKLIRHQLDPIPDIRQFRPDVPPGLAAVIRRMMAKRPDERYATALDTAHELGLYTEDAVGFDFAAPASPYQMVDFAPPESKSNEAIAQPAAAATAAPAAGGRTVRPVGPPTGPVSAGRTLRPISGPVAAAAATSRPAQPLKPKAIAKPTADATPSDSLPGADEKRPAPPTGVRPRRTVRRPTRRKEAFPVVPVAIATAVLIALTVVAAVILSRAARGGTSPTAADPGKPAAAGPPKSVYRPAAEILPDLTAAVLVTNPKLYWDVALAELPLGSPVKRHANFLGRAFKFDPFRFDRVLVAFQPNPIKCVAVGEGEVLANADKFRADLNQLEWFEATPDKGGITHLRFKTVFNRFNPDRRVRAALLPPPSAYLIASHQADLADLFRNADKRTAPDKVEPGLLTAVADATKPVASGSPQPVLTFSASGAFLLPAEPGKPGEPLRQDGVELLTLAAWLEGKDFRVELAVGGPDAMKLQDFLRAHLPAVVLAFAPGDAGKRLANAVRAAADTATLSDDRGLTRVAVRFRWDWESVHDVFDEVIKKHTPALKPD